MNMDETQALVAVVYRFFSGLDRRDNEAVAGLMADDGVWKRQGTELVGPDAVRAALAQRDPRRQTAHIVSNLWIEQATPDSARVRFYMTAYETLTSPDGVVGEPRMLGVRDCVDELVRVGGAWRIARKQSRRLLPAE